MFIFILNLQWNVYKDHKDHKKCYAAQNYGDLFINFYFTLVYKQCR